MPGAWIGYDPGRVRALRGLTTDAIEALRSITSADTAAAGAIAAVAVAREHLEHGWMPLLQRISGSEALGGWTGATWPAGTFDVAWWDVPTAQSVAVGSSVDVGHELAEDARSTIDGDEDAMERLQLRFVDHGDDAIAMATFFSDLGGGGTADLLMALGARFDADRGKGLLLARAVRDRLGEVASATAFSTDRFTAELVEGFAAEAEDSHLNPAVTLTFLFRGSTAPTDFVAGLTRRLIEHERSLRPGTAWPGEPGPGSVLHRDLADDDLDLTGKPLHAAMEALAAGGDAAREIFTDDALAAYLLTDHVWADGFRRVLAAGAAGATVPAGSSSTTWDEACVVATELVNRLGARGEDALYRFDHEAAESAANVLAVHMLAVQATLARPGHFDVGADELAALHLLPLKEASFGADFERTAAVFGTGALDRFTDLAVETDESVAVLRAGLAVHHEVIAEGTAIVLANEEPDDPNRFLAAAMDQSGRLEGYLIQRAGHQAERDGRSKDEIVAFWVDLASLSIGGAAAGVKRASDGAIRVPFVSALLRPAATVAKKALTGNEDRAERDAAEYAADATAQLTYRYVAALIREGVIERPAVLSGRAAPPFEELDSWPAAEQQDFWNDVAEAFPDSGSTSPDLAAIETAVESEQLAVYQHLD